jgi:putative transposase
MATAALEQGTLVKMDGVEHRLYRKVTDKVWQLEETKTGRFVERETEQLLLKISDRTLIFPGTGKVALCGPGNVDLSDKAFEIAKVRRAYVMRALGVANTQQAMERVIREVWEKIKAPNKPPCFTTVYLWKKRFLEAEKDIRALVDRTSAKGNRIGRYPAEVMAFCHDAIEAKYLQRTQGTIQDAYEEALIRTMTENDQRPECDALPVPTRRLVSRCIHMLPQFDKDRARDGSEKSRKDYRSLKGHVVTAAPLDRAQIDHTILDLFVVDDKTHLPLGRPYVTACIDEYSRCVLGMYIGFIPPSY